MDDAPDGQKKAPGCAATHRGEEKPNAIESTGTMFPRWVKGARNAWRAWPTWLGAEWLKERRRAAP